MEEERKKTKYEDPHWVIQNFNLQDENVINIYPYGSRVYGTASESSDWDYIIVLHEGPDTEETKEGTDTGTDGTMMSEACFMRQLQQHTPPALECIFLKPEQVILQRKEFPITIDPAQLRKTTSARIGHAWSKAAKKFDVAKEPYIAKKSLFHSFRILNYAIQVAENGRIVDYTAVNDMWKDIKANESESWADYKKVYQPLYNKMKSEFRVAVPKNWKD